MPYCPTCGQEYVERIEVCPECRVRLQAEPPPDPGTPQEHVHDVFETQDQSEADVIAGLLRANDIPFTMHSGVPQNVLPLHVDSMEAIRIAVADSDVAAARALIEESRGDGGAG